MGLILGDGDAVAEQLACLKVNARRLRRRRGYDKAEESDGHEFHAYRGGVDGSCDAMRCWKWNRKWKCESIKEL